MIMRYCLIQNSQRGIIEEPKGNEYGLLHGTMPSFHYGKRTQMEMASSVTEKDVMLPNKPPTSQQHCL
jgi:hypothetical protein